MKQLKINEPKVLKAILNKTKVKDIRKAYKESNIECPECGCKDIFGDEDKPPKYKVGEIVEVVWTGEDIELSDDIVSLLKGDILANVKIISIEKIEIDRMELNMKHPLKYFDYEKRKWSRFGVSTKILSQDEGFESIEDMFEWLESYANLSIPKPFWLYGLEYVK